MDDIQIKQRLHYIDVAKGLLILMVIIYHIGCQFSKDGITDNPIFGYLPKMEFLYTFFFMPAFFAITGFCSNFDKPYKMFLWSDFKALMIPAISLTILCDSIGYLSTGNTDLYYLDTYFAIRLLSPLWFLIALFWCKQIHYWLRRISKRILLLMVYLVIMGIGVWLNGKVMDYWHLGSSMIYAIFIFIGEQLKKWNFQFDDWKICVVPYIMLIGGLRLFSLEIASNYNGQLRIETIPLNIIGVVAGILMVLYIAKKMSRNRCLEYLGRHSLVIYGMHQAIISLFCFIFQESLIGMNMRMSVVALFALLTFVISICVMFAWLLNKEYLKWMIGKW